MRKVICYIAMSIDGYIADEKGGIDWLNTIEDEEINNSYSNFITQVDTVLMGRNTFDQIVNELSPNEWVYAGLKTYVITHREKTSQNEIYFVDKNPIDLISKLKLESGKDIWICGGANLIQQLIQANLIDTYLLTIIPVILGSGIRLFVNFSEMQTLSLAGLKKYNQIVELIYNTNKKKIK